jgi:CheY-like chemotaxis protein
MPLKFLVIDDHAEGRSLLTRTLLRKFPTAVSIECVDAGAAVELVGNEKLSAVIVHRAGEMPGVELIGLLREINRDIPILAVSGIDRSREALAAGANAFLNYDQWLMVGTVVGELLNAPGPKAQAPAASPGTATPRRG